MRNVDISLSSPVANEGDGRKAPGPNEQPTVVVSARLSRELAAALRIEARNRGLSIGTAAREAIARYTEAVDAPLSRPARGAVLGELIMLRWRLDRLAAIHAAQLRQGLPVEAPIADELRSVIVALARAAGRIAS